MFFGVSWGGLLLSQTRPPRVQIKRCARGRRAAFWVAMSVAVGFVKQLTTSMVPLTNDSWSAPGDALATFPSFLLSVGYAASLVCSLLFALMGGMRRKSSSQGGGSSSGSSGGGGGSTGSSGCASGDGAEDGGVGTRASSDAASSRAAMGSVVETQGIQRRQWDDEEDDEDEEEEDEEVVEQGYEMQQIGMGGIGRVRVGGISSKAGAKHSVVVDLSPELESLGGGRGRPAIKTTIGRGGRGRGGGRGGDGGQGARYQPLQTLADAAEATTTATTTTTKVAASTTTTTPSARTAAMAAPPTPKQASNSNKRLGGCRRTQRISRKSTAVALLLASFMGVLAVVLSYVVCK